MSTILSRCRGADELSRHGWFYIYLEYRRWFSPISDSLSFDAGILSNFPAIEGWYPIWFLPNPPAEIIPEISAEKVLPLTLYYSDGTFQPAWVSHDGNLIVRGKSSSPRFGVALSDRTREVRSVPTARDFTWKEIVAETRGIVFGEAFKKRNGDRKISHILRIEPTDTFVCRKFPLKSGPDYESARAQLANLVPVAGDDIRAFAPSLIEEFNGRNEPKFTKDEASSCKTYIEALFNKATWGDLTARENIKYCFSFDNTPLTADKHAALELAKSFGKLEEIVGQVYGNKVEEEVIDGNL